MLLAAVLFALQGEAPAALVERLASDRIEDREEAFRKLEEIGRPALPLLEKAAGDSDGEVASRARELILRIPVRERLTPALIRAVPGMVDRLILGAWTEVFLEIARDLRLPADQRKHPRAAAEDLSGMAPLALKEARTRADRMAVCDAAGRFGLKSAWPDAVGLLGGDDESERVAAARFLERVQAREAVDPLIRMAADPRVEVRRAVASALSSIGAPEAVPALIALLRDEDRNVRSISAHGLGRLNARSAVPHLIARLRDDSGDVRWWAVRALVELRAGEATVEIAKLREDPVPEVRRIAAEAAEALLR